MAKKKESGKNLSDMEHLNPVIVINEDQGDAQYAIVDFQEPGSRCVRRVIAKQVADGNISAAMYVGTVGQDGLCTDKRDLMCMENMPREKFWKMVRYAVLRITHLVRLINKEQLSLLAEVLRPR